MAKILEFLSESSMLFIPFQHSFLLRGGIPQLAVALLGVTLVGLLLKCVLTSLPAMDVPYCNSISLCTKQTRVQDSVYAREVGIAWYYANRLRRSIDDIYGLCALDLNWGDLTGQISRAVSGVGVEAFYAANAADSANIYAFHRMIGVIEYYHFAGVSCVPDMKIHDVYQYTDRVLREYGKNPREPLAIAMTKALQYSKRVGAKLGIAVPAITRYVPLLGVALKVNPMIAFVAGVIAGGISESVETPIVVEYLNLSVGRSSGLFPSFRQYVNQLVEAEREIDERAVSISKDLLAEKKRIDEILSEMERLRLEQIPPDIAGRFSEGKVSGSLLAVDIDVVVPVARAKERNYILYVSRNLGALERREYNFLCHLAEADRSLEKLKKLRNELEKCLETLEQFADQCKKYISGYRMSGDYEKLKRSILKGFKGNISDKIAACADGLKLVAEYERYREIARALEECEKEAAIYDYSCTGDTFQRYLCCKDFLEMKRQEVLKSELYKRFTELYADVEELAGLVGGPEAFLELSKINKYPSSMESLEKEYEKLLKLYNKLRALVNKQVSPTFQIEGYLDAEQLSEINIVVDFPSPVPEYFSIELPFDVVAARLVEGNDMSLLGSEKDKLRLKGKGSGKIQVIAYPAEPEVDVLGADLSGRLVEIRHTQVFPLKVRYSGEVVSYEGPVHWDEQYVYFDGSGSVLVREKPIQMEFLEEENKVLVTLTNVSREEFSRDLFIPVTGDGPSYCIEVDGGNICRVNMDPYEQRVIVFRNGSISEASWAQATATSLSSPKFELETEEQLEILKTSKERNIMAEVRAVAETLLSWSKRAKELNVVIPVSEDVVRTMLALAESGDVRVQELVLTYLSHLQNKVMGGVERAVYLAGEYGDNPEIVTRARALLKEDPVLAYALALSALPEVEKETIHPAAVGAIVLMVAGGIVAAKELRKTRMKKKRRIPRL